MIPLVLYAALLTRLLSSVCIVLAAALMSAGGALTLT